MPKTCPQCQTETEDDASFCPSCGAALSPPAGAGTPPPPPSAGAGTPPPPTPSAAGAPPPPRPAGGATPSPPPPAPGPGRGSTPPFKFDAGRWSRADWIAGIASIVLFISLFLSWFGVTVIGITVTASGVSAHGFLYVVMVICIVEVAYLVVRAGWDKIPVEMNLPHLTVMLVLTLVNLVLVFIAFIDKPGGSGVGWEFGAFLALIAAIVAAAPYAIPQLRQKTM